MEDIKMDAIDSKLTPYAFALNVMRKIMKKYPGYNYNTYREGITELVKTWGPKNDN